MGYTVLFSDINNRMYSGRTRGVCFQFTHSHDCINDINFSMPTALPLYLPPTTFCTRCKPRLIVCATREANPNRAKNCDAISHPFLPLKINTYYILWVCVCSLSGPGSSVGIATELRAGRSGIESRWGRDFPPVQTGPGAHPASCKMGSGSFPGVNCGRGVLLTTHPLLVPGSWKSRAILLHALWATLGL